MAETSENRARPGGDAADELSGPAKWAAIAVLAVLCVGGLVWSNVARAPIQRPTPAANHEGAAGGAAEPADGAGVGLRRGRIDLNTASAAELELLPGVGPAMAARIVADRAANGLFESVDALDRVPGIGPRTVERVKPLLIVADDPDDPDGPPPAD